MITERQFAPNRFQHCSAISKGPPGSGIWLAYYTGQTEMHQTQHVRIHWFSDEGTAAEPIDLGDYTGNPVLLETLEGTRIIYSKFETLVPNRIEWWQYCSTWTRSLDIRWEHGKPKIKIGAAKQIIVEENNNLPKPPKGLGYLARCNPIWYDNGYLLPLYREHEPNHHGVILYSSNGIDWEYRGSIGVGTRCIQPTIWYDHQDDKLCALLRRFSRSTTPFSYYSESLDGGRTWTDLVDSPFFNANNSILTINCRKTPLVVWNNDPYGRDKISLANFDPKKPSLIAQLDGYGSYPSACIDDKQLHVVYTARPNPLKTPNVKTVIKWKTYDLDAVLQNCKNIVCQNTSTPSSQSFSSPWRVVPPKTSPNPGNPSQP